MPETTTYTPKPKVTFDPNVPVQVALKYPVGKIVSGQYGEQVYYTTVDGKAMYLDLYVGQKVNDLGPKPGEKFVICKQWSGRRGDPVTWSVWLSPEAERQRAIAEAQRDGSDPELVGKLADSLHLVRASQIGQQPDGTFRVPGAGVVAPAPAKAATTNGNGSSQSHATNQKPQEPAVKQAWSLHLLSQVNELVDVYAAAVKHSTEKHGGLVKNDDIRSFLITSFIERSKRGGAEVA